MKPFTPPRENFDKWNEKKKSFAEREIFSFDEEGNRKTKILFKEGEVWWVSMGQNIGSESYGKGEQFSRPMYILKKFSQEAFIGIPCTTKEKEGNWYYPLKFAEQQSYLILPQMRYMSAKRLLVKISDTPEPEEEKIKNAVKKLLDF